MQQMHTVWEYPAQATSRSPWRTWLLLPVWVYALFIFVNLAQYFWMSIAAAYHHVPFGRVAGGSLKTPATEIIRGVAGPPLGVAFLVFALRFLAPGGLGWSVLRFRLRNAVLGGGMATLAIVTIMGILLVTRVAVVTGGPGRLPAESLAALASGKLLWTVFESALEDILFIGLLARTWAEVGSWRTAALRVGIFFGAIHLLNVLPVLTATGALAVIAAGTTFGALLTLLAVRYASLWVVISFHAMWNVWLGTVFGTTLSGGKGLGGLWVTALHGRAWLTGGVFGVEASALAILATGAILLRYELGLRSSLRPAGARQSCESSGKNHRRL